SCHLTQKPDCYFRKFVLHFVLHRVAFLPVFSQYNMVQTKNAGTDKPGVYRRPRHFAMEIKKQGQ
ncbi:MAG TPA: hypothetical protein H9763_08635, partial [Candidatus Eisenbergiella merdigallinarum]|nr:hypothetical protein [Candidatus Eisenbergiella merdigallinarum]